MLAYNNRLNTPMMDRLAINPCRSPFSDTPLLAVKISDRVHSIVVNSICDNFLRYQNLCSLDPRAYHWSVPK